jgi:hypothetical protein
MFTDQKKQPTRCNLVIEFIIPPFIDGSTCFEGHTAHHQELQTVFAASGLYTHVVTGCCPGCVGTGSGIWKYLIQYLDHDRSPHGYTRINQRLQILFGAPVDERFAARNTLSFQ